MKGGLMVLLATSVLTLPVAGAFGAYREQWLGEHEIEQDRAAIHAPRSNFVCRNGAAHCRVVPLAKVRGERAHVQKRNDANSAFADNHLYPVHGDVR